MMHPGTRNSSQNVFPGTGSRIPRPELEGGRMDLTNLKPIIEAMIFVAEEPLTENAILEALSEDSVERTQVRECLAVIEKEWNSDASRGIGLSQVAGGYQFRTKEGFADWIRRMNIPKPIRLSGPALETMAIVAYRQPITRGEIERIRGVDSGAVLKTLLERRLIRIVGRRDEPGQPLLYGTTKEFLETFNLKTLSELPTLKDIEEIMRERRALTESPPAAVTSSLGCSDEKGMEDIVDDEEEEETEVIKRQYPQDEENEGEDEKDMEALEDLTERLKEVRRLERKIFPMPPGAEASATPQQGDGSSVTASTSAPNGAVPQNVDESAGSAGVDANENQPDISDAADLRKNSQGLTH